MVGAAREFLLNHEQWEKHDEDDDLMAWLVKLGFSRSGALGPGDVVLNAYTGLRYERDLANMFVGPAISYPTSNIQNILRGMPGAARNSQNTNTAERTAAKSAYRITAAPAASYLLSALGPLGRVGNALRYPAMMYLTSNSASSHFADITVGEDQKKAGKPGPKIKATP